MRRECSGAGSGHTGLPDMPFRAQYGAGARHQRFPWRLRSRAVFVRGLPRRHAGPACHAYASRPESELPAMPRTPAAEGSKACQRRETRKGRRAGGHPSCLRGLPRVAPDPPLIGCRVHCKQAESLGNLCSVPRHRRASRRQDRRHAGQGIPQQRTRAAGPGTARIVRGRLHGLPWQT